MDPKTMDIINAILTLLAGLGAFLIGFKILSENIEKLANSGLKKLFKKTAKNRFIGVGIGALVTAIIQSSSAATVMVVGFVNAGVMDLFQATAMIMGANIGTTITAQIVSLNSLDIGTYLAFLTFIGIIGSMLAKKEKAKTIFLSFAGLGLVFLSLNLMSDSMKIFAKMEEFSNLLTSITNPFLLLLIGLLLTGILQSSSAVTTIIITMVAAGISIGNGGNSVLYVILGTNIGTTVTAIISSIGASVNARRASLIHLMFNTFASAIFMVILMIFPSFFDDTFAKWFELPASQIAMFHTFFNVAATILFLPFINVFVKLTKIIIKDKKEQITVVSFIDDRFLKTPSIAIFQAHKEVIQLGEVAMKALNESIDGFLKKTNENEDAIRNNISYIESLQTRIIDYLLKISSLDLITSKDEKSISDLHRILIDFTRESEIADNMLKYTHHEINQNIDFSPAVNEGILNLKQLLNQQFETIKLLSQRKSKKLLKESDRIEDSIDKLRSELIAGHIKRLEEGKCSPSSNSIFISLVSNLERAGDHLNYISHIIME